MSENATSAAEETNAEATENTNNEATENTDTEATENTDTEATENTQNTEDVSYHAVEKDGNVTAIWEMQGQKHLRTIDPRSNEGKQILALFETAA
ncbi:MAG TPA: hypothetical protein VGC97_10150 [Pyrinomonadaceae bacterium]|jgi:hypothetical protein